MEQHLREANKKAEEASLKNNSVFFIFNVFGKFDFQVLLEVTQRAKEAEKIKESVSKVKTKAEKIVARIETEKVGISKENAVNVGNVVFSLTNKNNSFSRLS